jgi:hypothetical protein
MSVLEMLYKYSGGSHIRKCAEMLFTMNTTNETTDGWDRLEERVLKIALCTLKINYTPNQR